MVENEIVYTSEWLEIIKLAKTNEIKKDQLTPVFDIWVNRKIEWFLFNGAVGVLYLLKEVFGKAGLNKFIYFILEYLNQENTPGHYYPSANIKTELNKYRETARLFSLDEYLSGIKSLMYENDYKKGGKNWQLQKKN